MDSTRESDSEAKLWYLIHHVFLPPKLPPEDDTDVMLETALVSDVRDSLEAFGESLGSPRPPAIDTCLGMIQRMLSLQSPGNGFDPVRLEREIRNLNNGGCLLLHLRAQNAGLLITADENDFVFETFELLATNEKVASCSGRLVRHFPGPAVAVQRHVVIECDLLTELAHVLNRLYLEVSLVTQPKTKKGGEFRPEERDTVSPILVTGMLVGLLQGIGRDVQVVRICKRSREQVNWHKAKLPWRRSAAWLLLRVGLRLVLDRAAVNSDGATRSSLYKPFIAYFLSSVLRKACQHAVLPSDVLYAMSAKIVRRIHKLNPADSTPWLSEVIESIGKNNCLLSDKWEHVQLEGRQRSGLDFQHLASLQFTEDADLSLPNLNRFFDWVKVRKSIIEDDMGSGDSTWFLRATHGKLPDMISYDTEMVAFQLIDMEAWTASHLEHWVTEKKSASSAVQDSMRQLKALIQHYYERAISEYGGNPESLSIMYLTTLELWVALDELACTAAPLLLKYHPGFPLDLLHVLVLSKTEHMSRLTRVEKYLSRRKSGGCQLPFEGFGSKNSFAVRYFDQSRDHQDLMNQIVTHSKAKRQEKLEELEREQMRYADLTQKIKNTAHDEEVNDVTGKVYFFEWPLPRIESEAKAAVFEIRVPESVAIWREVTLMLLADVFESEASGGSSKERLYFVSDFNGLRRFRSRSTRVEPASMVKPFTASHYSNLPVATATKGTICVQHGCKYHYFDRTLSRPILDSVKRPKIPKSCSFAMAVKPPLREWVESTVRTSNEVIAGQSKCPSEMRLNAFRAFGHLRAGVRIQWVNILCQLMAPSLDFDSEAACLLILQAIGEAGPPDGSIFRMAHSVTQFEHFVIAMADAMASALDRIEESWGHSVALACLVFLGTRLLSLAPTQSARDQLLALLSRLRKVSYTWIKRLVEKLGHCATGIEHVEWTPRILFASLICIATFGVGVDTLTDILKSAEEGELLLEVAVLAREHLPASGRPSGSLELVLFQRWRGIAYLSQAILGRQITSMRNSCLDRAVKQVWPDSPTSNTWMAGTDAQSHVLSTSVTSRNGRHPLHVAYNLLTGILLVNGLPLRKLPTKFRETEAYRLLFGTQNLSVMPSAAPEMQFCSATLHQGFKAHFAMIERKLVVHAVRDGRTLEFIPPDCLKGDFPTSFISDFSHWLDLSTMEVEFRPILTPWVSSQSNWTLRLTNERYNLTRDGRFLIDLHSATAAALSVLLLSIETATNLHLILEPDLQKLEIDLPRVGITFSIRQGESAISSKQYGGMCIDENQQFSTLIGLRSALVLRPEDDGVESSAFRKVLIPQGTVSSRKAGEHMEVAISISSDHLHHAYVVDDKLGRLVDNGTLRSKLQLSYLHALTSHCLPDPLTGRTGTEEALRILKSSAVLSFQKLDDHCATLLVMIAGISPVRQYYPSHLKCMEQTEWSASLPSLSQHEDFYEVVQAIRSHAAECELFFEDTSPTRATQGINQSDSSLIRRARIRNSTFRVSEFGAEAHSTTYDKEYLSRTDLEGIKKVYRSTVFLDNGSQTLLTSPPDSLKKSIQDVIGSVIEGPSSATGKPALKLRFHFGWLAEPAESFSGLWCRMNESLASMEHSRDKYRLMFFFAALIFAKNSSWDIVQLLLARAIIPSVRSVQLPAEPKFNRTYGLTLSENTLKILAQNEACAFEDCPEFSLPARQRESRSETVLRRRSAWQSASDARVRELTQELINQWPCKSVYIPGNAAYKTYIKTDKLQAKVQRQFLEIWRNQQLSTALDDLVSEMNRLPVTQIGLPPQGERLTWSEMLGELSTPSELGFVAVSSLFSRPAPKTTRPSATDFAEHYEWLQKTFGSSRLSNLLDELSTLASMNDPDQAHVKQYIEDLRQSFTAYQSSERQAGAIVRLREDTTSRRVTLLRYQKICRERALEIREAIEDCLQANSVAQKAAYQGGLWPRVSPVFLLQRLARHHWKELPEGWRHCITNYAIALTYLQQAERLLNSSSRPTDLIRELMSSAHTWDPLQYPESLLLEVEQGLLIRKVQDDVASEMRNPRGDHSSVMQLNMGEGKSSVIVPIIAAALADGTRLVRIIVGKPQSKQMAHILISRLGGLLDRRVFFLPFSRSVCLRFGQGEQIQRMMRSCRAEGGVLLVQPEQLLSFQLMGLEYRHSSEPHIASTGKTILDIHDECGRVARDIVDESDENFSVKFELVYTMGLQQPVDYSPDRWTIIQDVLQLVRAIAKTMSVDHGVGLQFDENESGGFPTIRVLDASAGKRLLDSVASRICSLGLRGFPVQHQPARVRRAVLAYISNSDINRDGMEFMDNDQTGFSSDSTIKSLLLLRGLFAKGILEFALRQKRFRVNYGLAPERRPRTMLAVPYRAKDSPAPRSEFSHPDVVIVLTCLSYYYAGLSDDELFVCFDYLSKSDHASREYDSWAHQAPKLGHSLHHYWAINVQDRSQCIGRVFPALRYIKPVIDFYLSRVVFPKEMKEFPQKLSASGWDLARRKTHPLTGFSGTNDSRYMLPLPIRSLDLPEQQHTNAAVLDCLLGDENCVLEIKADGSAECQLTAAALLAAVSDCKPEVQVILDVGAQIVELNNRQMAEAWLRMVPAHRVDAVIFFDDRDNLLVLTRNGLVDMFLASPFSNQTDRCLVFLDQAHTRGTDLRLPSHFRAAVTLGPSVTKDALVQACMRMRKLGKGQSVVFCVSPEMQHKIRALRKCPGDRDMTVSDILVWSISETWSETHRSVPLWATQGLRHQRQAAIWERAETENGPTFSVDDINEYLEDEAQTLEQRYLPGTASASINDVLGKAAQVLASKETELMAIKKTCHTFGLRSLNSATLQEEQERELVTEVEEERQVELPAPARPLQHSLHPDVKRFVYSGVMNLPSTGIIPVFRVLSKTKAGRLYDVSNFDRQPQEVLATVDFSKTVQAPTCVDVYQRPVQWILSGSSLDSGREAPQHLLIISPWEANELLPLVLRSRYTNLHLYSPRSSLSFRSLEDLTSFSLPVVSQNWIVPRLAVRQVNLFAGQLYLASYDEYVRLCSYLGLSCGENTGNEAIPVDGFVGRQGWNPECTFTSNPLGFLNILYKSIRGDCLAIGDTHMGRILAGEMLVEDEFQDEVQGH